MPTSTTQILGKLGILGGRGGGVRKVVRSRQKEYAKRRKYMNMIKNGQFSVELASYFL